MPCHGSDWSGSVLYWLVIQVDIVVAEVVFRSRVWLLQKIVKTGVWRVRGPVGITWGLT